MTARALFAMAAAAGCVFLGRASSFCLSQRESLLDDWARALRRMENEAVYRQSSALRTIAQGAAEEKTTLPALAQRMERMNDKPDTLLQNLPWDNRLTPREKETLLECLRALFLPTLAQQQAAFALAQREWAKYREKARAERDKYALLYASLGWLAGAALFILLC